MVFNIDFVCHLCLDLKTFLIYAIIILFQVAI
jgi:hypothetical protein